MVSGSAHKHRAVVGFLFCIALVGSAHADLIYQLDFDEPGVLNGSGIVGFTSTSSSSGGIVSQFSVAGTMFDTSFTFDLADVGGTPLFEINPTDGIIELMSISAVAPFADIVFSMTIGTRSVGGYFFRASCLQRVLDVFDDCADDPFDSSGFNLSKTATMSINPVPEPATLGLLGAGLLGLSFARRRRTA